MGDQLGQELCIDTMQLVGKFAWFAIIAFPSIKQVLFSMTRDTRVDSKVIVQLVLAVCVIRN